VTTAFATVVALLALSAAGLVPVVATVGTRWVALPLLPLAGSVVAGLATAGSVSFGGPLLDWFVGLAVAGALAVFVVWVVRPELGPWTGPAGRRKGEGRQRVAGAVGFVAVVVACAWTLRGLKTPTVGFDARALWVMRPGWFLQSHGQLLVDLRARGFVIGQSAYPPLVSSAVAVAWRVTGVHTARVGVTTVALLNACALGVAAVAVVDLGRDAAVRLARRPDTAEGDVPLRPPAGPMVAGVVVAVLLVLVAGGVTEPFLTNGYADPIWSLAAVGAVAYGLQSGLDRSTGAVAAVLVLVAGLSKNEGLVCALALVVLLAARSVGAAGLRGDRTRWRVPVVVAAVEVALLAWWPVLMHAIGARGASTAFTTSDGVAGRTSAVVHGMSPYLHVLVLAVPLAVVGGLALSTVRRRAGVGNDLWAWLALAVGLVAVGGALVTGSGAIVPWIRSTVHRITEYPVLQAWWIVGAWGVVALCGLARPRPVRQPDGDDGALASSLDGPVLDREAAPAHGALG